MGNPARARARGNCPSAVSIPDLLRRRRPHPRQLASGRGALAAVIEHGLQGASRRRVLGPRKRATASAASSAVAKVPRCLTRPCVLQVRLERLADAVDVAADVLEARAEALGTQQRQPLRRRRRVRSRRRHPPGSGASRCERRDGSVPARGSARRAAPPPPPSQSCPGGAGARRAPASPGTACWRSSAFHALERRRIISAQQRQPSAAAAACASAAFILEPRL